MEAQLVEALAKAKATCRENRLEIDKLRKRQRRRRCSGFTILQRRTSLVLYDMCNYTIDAPVMYLRKQHELNRHTTASFTDEELGTLLEDWFLVCTDVEIASLQEPTYPGDQQLFKVASTLHAKHRLRNWVFSENVLKGLAPACADVALKYDGFVEEEEHLGDGHAYFSKSDLAESKHRKWFQRWRLQYDINIGKIQTRDAFTREEIYSKARVLC